MPAAEKKEVLPPPPNRRALLIREFIHKHNVERSQIPRGAAFRLTTKFSNYGHTTTTPIKSQFQTPARQVQGQPKVMGYSPRDIKHSRLYAMEQEMERHKKYGRKVPLPFMEESVGITGRWKEVEGNFVLAPPDGIKPVGIVHFLGGAFVGAAPHISYRYLLETISERGLIIVATPYRLDLDYLRICDGIVAKFDKTLVHLKQEYGSLPIIGMGHSCGALLHTLLSSLFPDVKKDLNILISFNNRPASHAIPAFHELVVPLSKQVMSEEFTSKSLRRSVAFLRRYADLAVDLYSESSLSPTFVSDEILPLLRQGFELVDQVPPLLKDIARGIEEFSPSPLHVKEVLRMMYRTKKTLLIQFETDNLDGTVELEKLLKESNTIMRMKLNRTMENMDIERKLFDGSHVTPLTQNLLLEINPTGGITVPESYNRLREQFQANFMKTVTEVGNEISTFILQSYQNPSRDLDHNKYDVNDRIRDYMRKGGGNSTTDSGNPAVGIEDHEDFGDFSNNNGVIDFHSDLSRRRAAKYLRERLQSEEAKKRAHRPLKTILSFSRKSIRHLQQVGESVFTGGKSVVSSAAISTQETLSWLWISIAGVFGGTWKSLLQFITACAYDISALVKKLGYNINSFLVQLIQLVATLWFTTGNGIANIFGSFFQTTRGVAQSATGSVSNTLAAGSQSAGNIVEIFGNILKSGCSAAIKCAFVMASYAFYLLITIPFGTANRMIRLATTSSAIIQTETTLNSGMQNIQGGFLTMGDAVQSSLLNIFSGIRWAAQNFWSVIRGFKNSLLFIFYPVSQIFSSGGKNIAINIESQGYQLTTSLNRGINELSDNPIQYARQNVIQPIVTFLRSESAYNLGMDLVQQFMIILYLYFVPFAYA